MENEKKSSSIVNTIKEYVLIIGGAIIITVLLQRFVVFKAKIPSGSMIPTLEVNDQVFVSRLVKKDKLKRGDLVVFDSKEKDKILVKRLIGLPGETVELKGTEVFIDGKKLEEDYVKHPSEDNYTFNVPEGKYLFLGDNRESSEDARYWKDSYIAQDDVMGEVVLRIWPFDRIGNIE